VTEFIRTPDANFAGLDDFPFEPHFHDWQDMRVHYVDEGPADGPVVLLVHGMPTWSYLYRTMIPGLVAAGYRCIAPDHLGFGRSDKPTDLHWYTIARHTEVLTTLVTGLDLQNVTLVCQDWGGPTGLAQAATMPERFSRLVIMNTWLHHPEYVYSEAIHRWNAGWRPGGVFDRPCPDVALLLLLTAGLAGPEVVFPALTQGVEPNFTGDAARMYRGFHAPFAGLPDEAHNGLRRFPRSIPLDSYDNGNAAAQTHHHRTLLGWSKPVHFVWGTADDIFTEAWGRTWAGQMGATFDPITGAHHFLQNTHGPEIVDAILRRIAEEPAA
jgi:haloalkane dehalogenase